MALGKGVNIPLYNAILEARDGEKDREIIGLLLDALKETGTDIVAVIEHGPGINPRPAAAFVKKKVEYHGLDFSSERLHQFKENLSRYPREVVLKIDLVEKEITKINLRKQFTGIRRPLMVLFYNSFRYLLDYATSTHLAHKLAEKKIAKRNFSTMIERFGFEASEKEKSKDLIMREVVKKYSKFLEAGDVITCISTGDPYVTKTDAEFFYEVIKGFKWKKSILLNVPHEIALGEAKARYAEVIAKAGEKMQIGTMLREGRLREIESKKPVIIGVICLK